MKDKINELKIFYHGINNDISEINNICEVCTQKNLKFYKRSPCKQLLFIKPKDKLVVDLTYLPLTLIKNTEFKYLLNCIDHFSKYVVSFLLKTKKANEVCNKLNVYFTDYGVPIEIGTDNDSKFNNNLVKSLLSSKNIKYIRGKPYNPHSHGVCQRVHRTIRNGLICKYLENKKAFNIENALKFVVNTYNNTTHRTTKFKSYDVFYSNNDNIFDKVRENTLNSFKICYLNGVELNEGEPVLVFNNFEKDYLKSN